MGNLDLLRENGEEGVLHPQKQMSFAKDGEEEQLCVGEGDIEGHAKITVENSHSVSIIMNYRS